MKYLNHHRTLTVKDTSNRLSKSTNFDEFSNHPSPHPRTNTCANLNRSILRMQSSPAKVIFSHNDSAKQNLRPLSRLKTYESPLLSLLYSNILKHKHSHSRTLTTDKQRQIFLQRFSQTIKQDSFKITGFELDCQSLSFVFDYIKHSNTIVKIVLDGNALGFEGIKKLADLVSVSNIKELSLVSVGIGNKEASILFGALTVRLSIKKLNVSSIEGVLKNKITSEGVQNLKKLLNSPACFLEVLRMDYVLLGNEGLKTAFEGITNPSLQELSLSKNDISSKYMASFLSNISNITLIKLNLSKNSLSNEGLKVITELLGVNYGRTPLSVSLSHLNLSGNNMNSFSFQNFCRETYCNQTLQSLSFDDNPLGEGDRFFNIKYFIHKNWRLKELSLANISCSDKDLRCISESLQTNRSLEYLNISRNEIDNDTFYSLLSMLTRNKFLRKIQLNTCKISDVALIKSENLLTSNSLGRIQEISMQNNYLGNKAAKLFKQMLLANTNILKLALSKNCIGEMPMLQIKGVLKDNQRKRPFDREMNYFDSVIELYDQKQRNLKEQVAHLKEREEQLKVSGLIDKINHKQHVKSVLKGKIKLQKRSIAKMQKKLNSHLFDTTKEPSETGSKVSKDQSLYLTEVTPHCTMSEIHP